MRAASGASLIEDRRRIGDRRCMRSSFLGLRWTYRINAGCRDAVPEKRCANEKGRDRSRPFGQSGRSVPPVATVPPELRTLLAAFAAIVAPALATERAPADLALPVSPSRPHPGCRPQAERHLPRLPRSEEHTSELPSLIPTSYA